MGKKDKVKDKEAAAAKAAEEEQKFAKVWMEFYECSSCRNNNNNA